MNTFTHLIGWTALAAFLASNLFWAMLAATAITWALYGGGEATAEEIGYAADAYRDASAGYTGRAGLAGRIRAGLGGARRSISEPRPESAATVPGSARSQPSAWRRIGAATANAVAGAFQYIWRGDEAPPVTAQDAAPSGTPAYTPAGEPLNAPPARDAIGGAEEPAPDADPSGSAGTGTWLDWLGWTRWAGTFSRWRGRYDRAFRRPVPVRCDRCGELCHGAALDHPDVPEADARHAQLWCVACRHRLATTITTPAPEAIAAGHGPDCQERDLPPAGATPPDSAAIPAADTPELAPATTPNLPAVNGDDMAGQLARTGPWSPLAARASGGTVAGQPSTGALVHDAWMEVVTFFEEQVAELHARYEIMLGYLSTVQPGETQYTEGILRCQEIKDLETYIRQMIPEVNDLEGPVVAATDTAGGPDERCDSEYYRDSL